jgi:hypothetical protein
MLADCTVMCYVTVLLARRGCSCSLRLALSVLTQSGVVCDMHAMQVVRSASNMLLCQCFVTLGMCMCKVIECACHTVTHKAA